ncbi:MAG: YebC/PmpR family DNA-binding transcriptional regulator [Clostridia bacterium]|nr:YebC/PmpR family DNA-binding transcriptional regulator [Clostridia bacterium]
MSGHSKWSTIKHKKGKADAAKGKIFTKIGREIMVAVKMGGADPDMNSRLRDAIAKAKANNMPNDNVSRVIKKAAGENDDVNYEEIMYEGYGPGGVAVIVEAMTDNKNRTASNVRFYFDKNGGSLGATGCVNWMFDRKGSIAVEKSDAIKEDELMMLALEAGAEDFIDNDDIYEIITDPSQFSAVRDELEKHGIELLGAEIQRIPQNTVDIDEELSESINKMLDMMEDDDDVQNVYHNGVFL